VYDAREDNDQVRLGGDQGVPAWLLEPTAGAARLADETSARRRRARAGFLEKSLHHLGEAVEASFLADELSARPGLLQRLDPRVKLISLGALLIVGVFAKHEVTLACLIGLAFILALVSRIGWRRFVVRAWLVIPLFTGLVALPAITSAVTPGHALLTLWHDQHIGVGPLHLPQSLSVTSAGLVTASRLVLRVTAAVSFAALLTLTTRWTDLLRSLRAVGVPRAFVFILGMAFRYVHLLLRLAQEMFVARRSRTVGPVSSRENRRFVAAAAGALFGKSQAMGEQVYLAMQARGYTGEVYTLAQFRLRRLDAVWISLTAVSVAALVVLEQLAGKIL